MVTISVCKLVIAKNVYWNCPIILSNRVIHVYLLEIEMVDFDVILGTDWLYASFVSIDYMTRVVMFSFPNEPILDWEGEVLFLKVLSFLV